MPPDIGEVVEAAVGALVTWNDGQLLTLGTGDPFSFSYDVTDANAHFVKASYKTLAGNTVPIMALGIGIKAVDLTVFNGLTQPAYAVFGANRDSYIKMGFVSDDVAEILSDSLISIENGGVGIIIGGGASPVLKLSVSDLEVQGDLGALTFVRESANTSSVILTALKSRSGGVITSGDQLLRIFGQGHDGSDFNTQGAAIYFVTTGTIATDRIPGIIQFYTHPDSTSALAKRWSITETGVLESNGAQSITTGGNFLLTLTGGTAGVRVDNTLGVGVVSSINVSVGTARTFTSTTHAGSYFSGEIVTLGENDSWSGVEALPVITLNNGGTHTLVTGMRIRGFTATETTTSFVTNLAGLYIDDAPTYSGDAGDITNGPYAIFVDDGDVRFDGAILCNTLNVQSGSVISSDAATLSFAGAVSIDTSGNALLTLDGGTAGVRFNDAIGIDTNPDSDRAAILGLRTISTGGDYAFIKASETVTMAVDSNFYGLAQVAPGVTEATSGSHGVIAGLYLSGFTVTDGGGSEVVINLANLYIPGPLVAGTAPTNGPYSIFVDAGAVRFDGAILSNAGAYTICDASGNLSSANGKVSFSGAISNLTIANGIVTAAS